MALTRASAISASIERGDCNGGVADVEVMQEGPATQDVLPYWLATMPWLNRVSTLAVGT